MPRGGIVIANPQARHVLTQNNLSSQNLSFQIAVSPALPAAEVTVDHNLVDGFRGNVGEVWGTNPVEGDPLFVNAPAGNLRLRSASPAIDAASPAGAPDQDLDGRSRPHGAGYDIGAYEYVPAGHVPYLPPILDR